MRTITPLLAACAAGMLLVQGGAAAQSAAASPCPLAVAADSARRDSAGADVVIVASATVQELRFNSEPRARLRVLGCGEGEGLRVLERRNLPERVQPGVTYRDVYVSVRILGTLNAACIAALAGDSTAARGIVPGACVSIGVGGAPPSPPPAPPPP
jgi:Fe2+ transport system protein FeoA